jgi:hypothetical protein
VYAAAAAWLERASWPPSPLRTIDGRTSLGTLSLSLTHVADLYTTGCCFSQIASITDRMQMGCWKEDGKRPWSEEAKALDKQAKQLLQKHLGGSDGGHWGFWAMQFFDFAQYGLFAVVYSLFLCFGVPPTAPAGYVYPMQLNGYNPIAPVGLVGFRPDV